MYVCMYIYIYIYIYLYIYIYTYVYKVAIIKDGKELVKLTASKDQVTRENKLSLSLYIYL